MSDWFEIGFVKMLLAYTLFMTPVSITGIGKLLMLIPLALSISIVYKTIRCDNMRSVPLESIALCVTIVFFMMGLGVSLWGMFLLLA